MSYQRLPTEPELSLSEEKSDDSSPAAIAAPSAFASSSSSSASSPALRSRSGTPVASNAAAHSSSSSSSAIPASASTSSSAIQMTPRHLKINVSNGISTLTPASAPPGEADASASAKTGGEGDGEGEEGEDEEEEDVQPPFLNIKRVQQNNRKVSVKLDWTIDHLKSVVCPEDYEANKRIRMIFQGKILDNDQSSLEESGLHHDAYVHVVVTESRTQADIEAAERESAAQSQGERDEAIMLEQLRLQQYTVARNPEGTNVEFVFGFVLGSFLGVIMLIWLWQPRASRRQKLGILLGILTNIILSWQTPPQAARGGGGTGSNQSASSSVHPASVSSENAAMAAFANFHFPNAD